MALGSKKHPIERFGERAKWLVSNLEPDANCSGPIHNLTDLWLAVARAMQLDPSRSERTWKRSIASSDDYAVPDAICKGLLRVYPDVPAETLLAKSFADFESHAVSIVAARSRWTEAVRYLARNRAIVAEIGKRYHRAVDDDPDFPIIVKKGWILPKPVELTENSPLPTFDPFVKELPASRLEGLNVDFVSLRASSMKRQPINTDSYRVLDVQPRSGRLNVTFGTTQYYQMVNTCEAMGAELADFVRQNPGQVPTLLKHRGAPASVFDFKRRSTYAVVACLLLIKNYSRNVFSALRFRNKFMLHERGDDTLESQNTVAVVPAGGHEPTAANYGDDTELSIWHTVVREFCEELFNKEVAATVRRDGESFLDLAEVKPYVDAFFRSDVARVYLMGAGLDPVTTKCEFLITIVADWRRARTKMEFTIAPNWEGKVSPIDLSKANLLREANRVRQGKPLYPSSKACLLLAAQHYDLLMG
jgi:hypothetical protein